MSKNRFRISNRRRQNMMYIFLSRPERETRNTQESSVPNGQGILIFKSELDYISRCILDRKNIETGGQLFGYWSEDGRPVAASTNAYGQLMTSKKMTTKDNVSTRGYVNVDILIEVNVADESTKFGLNTDTVIELVEASC